LKYFILYNGGKYTKTEISNLINNDGYVPVATGAELNEIRNTVSQTMGIGTIWENTYLTGRDKKYIQVSDLDMSLYTSWNYIPTLTGLIFFPLGITMISFLRPVINLNQESGGPVLRNHLSPAI
jgi:hypothetical protein